jgi:hypothetical protein
MDRLDRKCVALTIRRDATRAALAGRATPYLANLSTRQRDQFSVQARFHETDLAAANELPLPVNVPPTPEEIEFHASLCERVAKLHRERPGLWSALRHWVRTVRVD